MRTLLWVLPLLIAASAGAAGPEFLAAPRVYFVHPDGDDANTCLVDSIDRADFPRAACRTLQSVYDRFARTVDTNLHHVTIRVGGSGARVLTEGLDTSVPWRGHGTLDITGDPDNPDNVTIDVAEGAALRFADAQYTGKVQISGFRLRAPNGPCIRNGGRLDVWFGKIHFAECKTGIAVEKREAYIRTDAPYKIAGSGHVHADADAGFIFILHNVAIEGNPEFSAAFLESRNAGYILIGGAIEWSGTARGQQYRIQQGGVISTLGGPPVPGSIPGRIHGFGGFAP
jgi:hypothetical protein